MGDEIDHQVQDGDGHQQVPTVELMPIENPREASLSPQTDGPNVAGATPPTTTAGVASNTPASENEIEKGSTGSEQRRTAKDIEFGAVVAVFSFAVMLTGFFLSPTAAKATAESWRLDVLMLLAFASFIIGFSFMLLSMQLLGAPEIRVPKFHRIISKCLFYACSVLPALTLVGLLVLMPFKPYVYVGLAVLAVLAVPVAILHCYVSHRTAGEEPDDAAELLQKQQDQMEASFKITAAMAASSFAGLVGMLFGVYKQSGAAITGGVHVAIMFMFSTAVVSMLLMMLSMKVLEINNTSLRSSIVRVIRYANMVLLCSLAVAALSAAFVILQCYVLAAFVSLAVAGIVHFIIQNCTTAQAEAEADRVDQHQGRQAGSSNNAGNSSNSNQETRLKWLADIGSKVTAYSLGGVMAIFGGFLGDGDNSHDKMVAIRICMFLLTSAFASGLGLMLLTTRCGGSAHRVGFKAATSILSWSAMGLLAAAALAIYGVEVMKS
ncbi:hypothetical protein EJB05_41349, partial [Eragrostis curvula]